MKQALTETVGGLLVVKGYAVKTLTRACFDIVARSNSRILLIKILEDANAVTRDSSEEMKKLSSYINAAPLIVAERASAELVDNVVYSRFGIYTMNLETFRLSLENNHPFIRSTHAGITAKISGKRMSGLRERKGVSLSLLSRKAGVSRRMIIKYENESSAVLLKTALRLYDIFGGEIFDRVDVFSSQGTLIADNSSYITKKYAELGFESASAKRAPFSVIARKGDELILTGVEKANPQAKSLAMLVDADNLVIFRKERPKDIPALTKKEFLGFDEAEELVRFIKEF